MYILISTGAPVITRDPPTLLSATIGSDGVSLLAVFDQNLYSDDLVAGFALTANEEAVEITAVEVDGAQVTFTIATVYVDAVCEFTYDAEVGDVLGIATLLASFTAAVTNNSAQTEGGISCAVPLDDPGTLADMFSLSLLPMDAPGKQTFTFANQADGAEYIALPADALGADNFPRPATNPMAAQYKITAATLPASSAATYGALMVVVLSAEGAPLGQAYVRMFGYSAAAVALGSGGYGELYVNDTPVAQSEFATSIAGKSTAYFVKADGSIGYTVAGVYRGSVPGLTVGATDRVLFALRHKDAAGGGGAGTTFSGAYLTSAADIDEPMPTNTTDLCGTAISAPAATCAYLMDADATEVQGVGYYDVLDVSASGQKAALTVNNGLGGDKYYAAFTHNTFDTGAVKIDLSGAGKKVIQQIFTIPTLTTGGVNQLLTMNAYLYGSFRTEVKCYANGQFELRVYGAAQAYVIPQGMMAPGELRLTFEIDTDAATFGVRVNGGALVTLSNNTYNPTNVPLFVEVIQLNGGLIASGDNGKELAIEFVTAAPSITAPVSSGYGDACGNPT